MESDTVEIEAPGKIGISLHHNSHGDVACSACEIVRLRQQIANSESISVTLIETIDVLLATISEQMVLFTQSGVPTQQLEAKIATAQSTVRKLKESYHV